MIYSFEDYELDTRRFELRCAGETVSLEPQVFSVLSYLVERRDEVVTKDEILEQVWGTTFLADATLATRIMEARRAIGDDGRAQRLIKTVPRRGYRFVGAVMTVNETADSSAQTSDVAEPQAPVRFCTASDGTRIAYSWTGEGPPFIKVANWLTHLEFDLQSPVWRQLITELVPDRRLIRYDARGSGLSDWDVPELSLDVWVRDLESVVDALQLDRFPLLGISQGGAIALTYALRHPERVTHLVLHGAFARGRAYRGEESAAVAEALNTLAAQGWGRSETAFSRLFAERMIPGGTREQQQWLADLQRISTSAENAVRFMKATGEFHIVDRLKDVSVPTLVTHSRGDQQVAFEEGRLLAAEIPDARLIALESQNHLILEGEPAWARFRDEVRAFIAV